MTPLEYETPRRGRAKLKGCLMGILLIVVSLLVLYAVSRVLGWEDPLGGG